MADWHPHAERVPYPSAGAFVPSGKKLLWHTTEGFELPTYKGDAPHFTLVLHRAKLYQHVPISSASSSLEHPRGTPETNHAGCVQVELAEQAAHAAVWPDSYYAQIAALARWIEANADVPRRCTVRFAGLGGATRMSPRGFISYAGHCGHEHAPSQPAGHWDPGALRIRKVLAGARPASTKLEKWKHGLAALRKEAACRKAAGRRPWTLTMRVRGRLLKQLIAREEAR